MRTAMERIPKPLRRFPAAEIDPARAGRMKFMAGVALSGTDSDRARGLFSEASESQDAALLDITAGEGHCSGVG